MKTYWIISSIIISTSANMSSIADEAVYTLDTAPWAKQSFEICKPVNEHAFRPVIFPPEYQSVEFIAGTKPAMTKLSHIPRKTLADGTIKSSHFVERVIPAEELISTYQYLENQTIGYLNSKDEWVDENGKPVKSISKFTQNKNRKKPPKYIPIADWHLPYDVKMPKNKMDKYIEQIKTGANCRHLAFNNFATEYTQLFVNSGNNNAFSCLEGGGFERNQNLNYIETRQRQVVRYLHGDIVYLKDQFGKFHVTSFSRGGFEKIDEQSNQSKCDWKALKTD